MPLDTSIAMGYKPVQMPNQLANYAQMQQIMGAQQSQEASQMQLEKMKRDEASLSTMMQAITAKGGPSDPMEAASAMIKSGIPHYMDAGLKLQQAAEQQKRFASIIGGAPAGSSVPVAPAAAPEAGGNALAPTTPVPAAPVNALADQQSRINAAYQLGTPSALAWAKAQEERMKPIHGAAGGFVYDPITKSFVQAPEKAAPEPAEIASMRALGLPLTQAGYQTYRDAQRQERLLTPEELKQKLQVAAAGRAPSQPVAPTITQIVDPTNPNQMITVDARRYQGGGAGSAGVIGVGGKEPGAALRQNKVEAGKTQLADDLDNLRASFRTLNEMNAIPSTERGVMSNISSATAASGIGQMLGRATGTEAQVERDVINSARQRLVNSIKNATGMSAQQLNSNVELQTMLKSISDPGQSVQAALRIIDDIENAYVKGTGELPKRSQTGKVTSTQIAPADKQALDWANANPKDPRALQIKQRLGQ